MFGSPEGRTDWNFANVAAMVYNTGNKTPREVKEFVLRMGGEDELEQDDFTAMKVFALAHNARLRRG